MSATAERLAAWRSRFDALEGALDAPRPPDATFRLGIARVAVRAATRQLESWFTSGLWHLAAPDGPGLRLEVAVRQAPDPHGVRPGSTGRGGFPRYAIGDGRSLVGAVWPRQGFGALLDRSRSRGVIWAPDPDQLLPADAAVALRALVAWWLPAPDYVVAHSAAVAGPRGAALMVGPGGSGKSSTALASLLEGLGFLGDDTVLLHTPTAEVLSLSAEANLFEADLRLHGRRVAATARGAMREGKRVAALRELSAALIRTRASIRALVQLRVDPGGRCRLAPLDRGRLLSALAPSSMLTIPGYNPKSFAGMAALARRLPAYELTLTGSPAEAAGEVASLLGARRAG